MAIVDFRSDINKHYTLNYERVWYIHPILMDYLSIAPESRLYEIAEILFNKEGSNFLYEYYHSCMSIAADNYGLEDKREGYRVRNRMCAEIGKYIIDKVNQVE